MRVRNLKDKKEILENSNYYIDLDKAKEYKGKWNQYFKNDNPICLEIGCGKCKFIYEMAKKNPNKNFIGMERIDTVLALGIKEIEKEDELSNLVLINIDALKISEVLLHEIEILYLNFSDPWPKARHEKRRLTSFNFLKEYDIIFKDDMVLEFKTDNTSLFEYSIVSLSKYGYKILDLSFDLHNKKDFDNIITEYEKKFSNKGFKIKYFVII